MSILQEGIFPRVNAHAQLAKVINLFPTPFSSSEAHQGVLSCSMSVLQLKRLYEFEGGGFTPHSLAYLPEDDLLLVSDREGSLHVFDTLLGKLMKSIGIYIYIYS